MGEGATGQFLARGAAVAVQSRAAGVIPFSQPLATAMSRLRKILRLQFGLRTLLAVVLVGALVSAYVADLLNTSRAQRRFLELAKEAGIRAAPGGEELDGAGAGSSARAAKAEEASPGG